VTQQPEERGAEDRVASVINTVMGLTLLLAFTLFGLWGVVSSIGPARAVFDALPAQAQQTLGRLLSSFAVCVGGMALLWRMGSLVVSRRVGRTG
jgi:hypothetical protein